MCRLCLKLTAMLLVAVLLTGCSGSKETGKNKDYDKPKPAESG